jgi:hypothetical protein
MFTGNRRHRVLMTMAVAGLAWGTLSLGQAGVPAAASAACTVPSLTGFTGPALVNVGASLTVTVTLSCAPPAPASVSLNSDNSDLPVPATVTVPAGQTTADVSLTPLADAAGQYQATLTAQLGTMALTQTITVDPGLASLQLPDCGDMPNCVDPTVLFTGPAPAGGLTVQFASSSPAVVVPASQNIQAGALGGDIITTVNPVTTKTPVTISATLGGTTLQATKVLLPPFGAGDHITLQPESGQTRHIYGQEFDLEYQALLSNPAGTDGVTVTYSTPSASLELQNTTDVIPPGFTDSFTNVNTANVTAPVHTRLVVTADGVRKSLRVVIEPGLASFTGLPKAIEGGRRFTVTITLAGPVDTRTTVSLQSSQGVLNVPALVHIPAGHSSATVTATTVPVTSRTPVFIIAMLGSTNIQSANITLTP